MAKYHGRAGQGVDMAEQMDQARAFANGPSAWHWPRCLPGCRLAAAGGRPLRPIDRPGRRYVMKNDLRVLDFCFRKELLCQEGKIVGCYDGRTAGYAPDQASEDVTFTVDDTYLDPAYASLCNAYLRDEPGWRGREERKGFADFDLDSTEPGKSWNWWHKLPDHAKSSWGDQIPFPDVTQDLAAAAAYNPTMKVMIGNGIYDLCTPFGQTEYDIDHLGLPAPLRRNIAFIYYPAGHMLYTSPESLARFSGDLKRFYATDATGMEGLNERPASATPRGLDA